jgi:crotonobetainyl-CoA:carnitine CoA-transferase CaiB-like acyl-CoA transferase
MMNPTINSYQDRDGRWFWLIGLEAERHWPPLCRAVGHPEWIEEPQWATPLDRAMNAIGLIEQLDAIFATKTRDEWGKIFDAEPEMWWAPVQTADEVLEDAQVLASGALVEVPDEGATSLLPATPCDFAGTPWAPRAWAPELGQHTDEVLGELGRSPDDIAQLRDKGIVT